jgi:hypothetical protein
MKQTPKRLDRSELYRNGLTVFSSFNNFKGGVMAGDLAILSHGAQGDFPQMRWVPKAVE